MSDPTVRNADAMAREAIAALLPFTSHSIGCAIYQRSWASGEPPCTCGLDDARALAALSPADGDAGVEAIGALLICDSTGGRIFTAWPVPDYKHREAKSLYRKQGGYRTVPLYALTPTETGEQGE